MNNWRWIFSGQTDGATQMAIDRSILEHAVELGRPTMRVYCWQPHCISIGYHQDEEVLDLKKCKESGIDVVRRPTGGRAVFHAEEVTYSVIIPKDYNLSVSSISEIYNLISRGLARGIQKLGIPAELQKRSLNLHAHYKTSESVSCFSAAARHEVLVNGRKLIGSAQRRLVQGVLQHGSILTGKKHLELSELLSNIETDDREQLKKTIESKTITIGDFLDIDIYTISDAIKEGIAKEVSVKFSDEKLSEQEVNKIPLFRDDFLILSN